MLIDYYGISRNKAIVTLKECKDNLIEAMNLLDRNK